MDTRGTVTIDCIYNVNLPLKASSRAGDSRIEASQARTWEFIAGEGDSRNNYVPCLLCIIGSRSLFHRDIVQEIDTKLVATESKLLVQD